MIRLHFQETIIALILYHIMIISQAFSKRCHLNFYSEMSKFCLSTTRVIYEEINYIDVGGIDNDCRTRHWVGQERCMWSAR